MVPFIFFLFFFCHTKCTKKERKNTLQNKSDEEALNRNHGAYTCIANDKYCNWRTGTCKLL